MQKEIIFGVSEIAPKNTVVKKVNNNVQNTIENIQQYYIPLRHSLKYFFKFLKCMTVLSTIFMN